jgi:hypothetical protein
MASAFDQRIIRAGIEIDGQFVYFDGLDIRAAGTKTLNPTQNQCTMRISNLSRDMRNYLLTRASPRTTPNQTRTPVLMTLDVGRESTGTFRLFEGQVFSSTPSQPPDIAITFRSLTNNFLNGLLGGYAQSSSMVPLRAICDAVAKSMKSPQYPNGLSLDFQAQDKLIENYSYSGSASKQLEKLQQMGGVDATIDNGTLLVLASNQYRTGGTRLINMETGMIGIPNTFDGGIIVKMMVDNTVEIGRSVTVESKINPAANGEYKVKQINFEVANRDNPFWYTIVCSTLAQYQGNQ